MNLEARKATKKAEIYDLGNCWKRLNEPIRNGGIRRHARYAGTTQVGSSRLIFAAYQLSSIAAVNTPIAIDIRADCQDTLPITSKNDSNAASECARGERITARICLPCSQLPLDIPLIDRIAKSKIKLP
jgi:hypothetical protein